MSQVYEAADTERGLTMLFVPSVEVSPRQAKGAMLNQSDG